MSTKAIALSVSRRDDADRLSWRVLAGFFVFIGLLLVAHGGRVLEVGFTPIAVVAGVYFLFKNPRAYLVYLVVLLWCTPFVRRVAEDNGGYVAQSQILAAPLLVAFSSVLRIASLRLFEAKNTVFVLPFLAILYGAAVGVLRGGVKAVAVPLVAWVCPLVVGVFCYLHEDEEKSLSKTFMKAVSILAVVVALYGIYQYYAPPAWDTSWLTAIQADGQGGSMGSPEPQGIRVFATCNNSQGAGSLFGFAILLVCLQRFRLKAVALAILIFALLLTNVRSSWLATLLGALILLVRAGPKARVQAALFVGVLVVCGVGLASTPLGDNVAKRFSSFGSLDKDTSYRERQMGRAEVAKIVRNEPFGLGIGYATSAAKQVHFSATDLGITTMPIELGYLGSIFYGVSVLMLVFGPLWKGLRRSVHMEALAAGMLFTIFLFANTNPLNNGAGVLFWIPGGFLAHYFASRSRADGDAGAVRV